MLIGCCLVIVGLTSSSVLAQQQPAPLPANAASYYLVSLADAPLAEAAEAVITQSLGSSVSIDPGLDGRISFQVAERLTEAEVEIRFATALADENIALVKTDTGFRLMDLAAALAVRPALDVVAPPLPQLKSGALAFGPIKALPLAPRSVGRLSLSATIASALALMVAGLTIVGLWFFFRRWKATEPARQTLVADDRRQAVVDRLLSENPVDLQGLAKACDQAARQARPVEQVLCDLRLVEEEVLADAYCEVSGLCRWEPELHPCVALPESLGALDAFVARHDLRVVEVDDWSVTMASADPFDDQLFAQLSRLARRMVTLRVARKSEVRRSDQSDAAIEPLIIPWSRTDLDGSVLLQAILNRRLTNTAASA